MPQIEVESLLITSSKYNQASSQVVTHLPKNTLCSKYDYLSTLVYQGGQGGKMGIHI